MQNRQIMCAVFDSKTGAFGAPFFAPTVAAAMRSVSDAANDPSTQLSRHPADFELIVVGEFDLQTGVVSPVAHQNLGNMTQFLRTKENPPLLRAMEGGR